MGFFSYAYVIQGHATKNGITFEITAYTVGGPALFSWGPGSRPPGLETLADGTLFCSQRPQLLPGYPRTDQRDGGKDDSFYIEESFFAQRRDEPVLFHVVLPPRFVIRPDRTPFTLTKNANISTTDDRLFFTLPAVGGADLRFWIARMANDSSFDDYELDRLLCAPEEKPLKVKFELNFGIAKLTLG
jgi:hypothetical protein